MAEEKAARIDQLIKVLHDELAPDVSVSTRVREKVETALKRIDEPSQIEPCQPHVTALKKAVGPLWTSKSRFADKLKQGGFPLGEFYELLCELKNSGGLQDRPAATMAARGTIPAHRAAKPASNMQVPAHAATAAIAAPRVQSTSGAGYMTPAASVAAVATPAPSGDSSFGGFSFAAPIASSAAAPTPTAERPRPALTPSAEVAYYPQSNPVYQMDATDLSPLPRKSDYTPSLSQQMSQASVAVSGQLQDHAYTPQHFSLSPSPTTAAPHAARGTAQHVRAQPLPVPDDLHSLQPTIVQNGDLLLPDEQLVGRMTAEAQLAKQVLGVQQGLCTVEKLHRRLCSQVAPDTSRMDQLKGSSQDMQAAALMSDLMFAFKGQEGRYIKAALLDDSGSGSRRVAFFLPRGAVRSTLHEQVSQLLPVCEHVLLISRFIATRRDRPGVVAQAASEQMRSVLDQWWLMVAQLNTMLRQGELSLQKLACLCQKPAAGLRLFAEVAAETAHENLTAAGLLNMLQRRQSEAVGDADALRQLQELLRAAARPYFRILEAWLCRGVLEDPWGDFMVAENLNVTKQGSPEDNQVAYWAQRYYIRLAPGPDGRPQEDVPSFLQACKSQVLTTGKYLNTIRECGQSVVRPLPEGTQLQYDPHGLFQQHVAAAHRAASAALLRFMMQERQLPELLTSIKHFFLLDQGDVAVHLVSQAKEELMKSAKQVNRDRLKSLLELAIKTSSVGNNKYADSVVFEFCGDSTLKMGKDISGESSPSSPRLSPGSMYAHTATRLAHDERLALDSFLMSIRLEWPDTLVVPGLHVRRYQLIFKHLFQYKYSAMELSAAWQSLGRLLAQQQRSRERPLQQRQPQQLQDVEGQQGRDERERQRAAVVLLRYVVHRLLHLVQEYVRYMCQDVLEPLWQAMEAGIAKASNLDLVMSAHERFLRLALEGTLLAYPRLVRKFADLQMLSREFGRLTDQLLEAQEQQLGSSSSSGAGGEAAGKGSAGSAAMAQAVAGAKQLDERYEQELHELLGMLQRHHEGLLQRKESAGLEAVEEQRLAANCLQNLMDRLQPNKPGVLARAQAELQGL